jgi:GNAT superfamily N-acetyltransferase
MNTEAFVVRLTELPADRLADHVAESEAAGFAFLGRLVDEWESEANRFARPGEGLVAAVLGGRVVGVCGLSVDPYTARERVGRVRHLYVAAGHRRRGVGSLLIAAVVAAAEGVFDRLRLRTDSEPVARFYEAIGFQPRFEEAACTHVLDLAI